MAARVRQENVMRTDVSEKDSIVLCNSCFCRRVRHLINVNDLTRSPHPVGTKNLVWPATHLPGPLALGELEPGLQAAPHIARPVKFPPLPTHSLWYLDTAVWEITALSDNKERDICSEISQSSLQIPEAHLRHYCIRSDFFPILKINSSDAN